MTEKFNAVVRRAHAYALRLIARGWPAEDVAAALIVEGAALSNATAGRRATNETLRGLSDHQESHDGG